MQWSSNNEVIILRGSGRGRALLSLNRGFDRVPSGAKVGLRLIGHHARGSLEVYIESITFPGEFYYDCSIGGPWSQFENLTGIYNNDLVWIAENNDTSVATSVVSAMMISEELSSPEYQWSQLGSASGPYYPGGYNSASYSVPPYSAPWSPPKQPRPSRGTVRTISTKKIQVIKVKTERKLALDKDI